MKYIMRQSRDGAVELIDRSPAAAEDGDLLSAVSRLGWGTALIWYMRTLAWVWVAKGLFDWAIILGAFPSLGQFTTMALPLQATIVAFACLDLLGRDRAMAGGAVGRRDLAPVRGGRGRLARPEPARRRDRLRRRAGQCRARGRLFRAELSRGPRTHLTIGSPSAAFLNVLRPPNGVALADVCVLST